MDKREIQVNRTAKARDKRNNGYPELRQAVTNVHEKQAQLSNAKADLIGVLVEQGRTEFFSINWAALRREVSLTR